jgi:hypothetical protein
MESGLVRWGIPSIALLLAALFVAGVYAAERRAFDAVRARRHALIAASGIAGFLAFVAALALTGLLARFDLRPPPLMLWMVATLGSAVALGLSPLGRRLAELPLVALVGFQAFRLPLELVMHRAAVEGVMPSIMSYGGYNFDIVSGITALVLGVALARGSVPRVVVVAWNVLGSLLLAVIVTVAFLATPLVRAFGDTQINLWITQFPYSWMALMVSAALLGHVLLARKLWAESHRNESGPEGLGSSPRRAFGGQPRTGT